MYFIINSCIFSFNACPKILRLVTLLSVLSKLNLPPMYHAPPCTFVIKCIKCRHLIIHDMFERSKITLTKGAVFIENILFQK